MHKISCCCSFAAGDPDPLFPVFRVAKSIGVEPFLFVGRGSAPASMSALTAAAQRLRTARCMLGIPSGSLRLALALPGFVLRHQLQFVGRQPIHSLDPMTRARAPARTDVGKCRVGSMEFGNPALGPMIEICGPVDREAIIQVLITRTTV
jgi:hypothetical protein